MAECCEFCLDGRVAYPGARLRKGLFDGESENEPQESRVKTLERLTLQPDHVETRVRSLGCIQRLNVDNDDGARQRCGRAKEGWWQATDGSSTRTGTGDVEKRTSDGQDSRLKNEGPDRWYRNRGPWALGLSKNWQKPRFTDDGDGALGFELDFDQVGGEGRRGMQYGSGRGKWRNLSISDRGRNCWLRACESGCLRRGSKSRSGAPTKSEGPGAKSATQWKKTQMPNASGKGGGGTLIVPGGRNGGAREKNRGSTSQRVND